MHVGAKQLESAGFVRLPDPEPRVRLLPMLSRRTIKRTACVLTFVLLYGTAQSAFAGGNVQGTSCTPGGVSAGIGTGAVTDANNLVCVSNVWQYPVYVLQSAAAAAQSSCSGYPAGAERWNTTITNVEVCDGTTWQSIGNTSNSCGSITGLSFTDVTGAPLSTLETSGAATITYSGCSSALSVSVTGGGSPQISINGGGWTTSGSIYSGQTLQVRLTSSASASTQLTATVTVQTTSTNWHVTTAASDPCSATSPSIGTVCSDGSIYAGITPDGYVKMFIAPCDAGMTGSAGSCTGTAIGLAWSAGASITTGVTSQSTGKANTAALYADDSNADAPYYAANYCYTLNYLGHTDWYLPALGELEVIATNYAALSSLSPFSNSVSSGYYLSSTEYSSYDPYFDELWSNSVCVGGCGGGFNKETQIAVHCARHN